MSVILVNPKDIKVNNGDNVSVHIIHLDAVAPYVTHVNTVKSEPLKFKLGQFLDQGIYDVINSMGEPFLHACYGFSGDFPKSGAAGGTIIRNSNLHIFISAVNGIYNPETPDKIKQLRDSASQRAAQGGNLRSDAPNIPAH